MRMTTTGGWLVDDRGGLRGVLVAVEAAEGVPRRPVAFGVAVSVL
jgi:hypothetical protein